MEDEKDFNVMTYSKWESDGPMYCHWSEGLTMVIRKGDVTLTLNGEEVQQLVNSLPRTVGGVY